jgi:pimeloyl-ACP methyl ester carboxylesterase
MDGPMSLLAVLLTMSTTTSQTGIANSADGVPIHYATQGQGDIAVVLVHGWAINRRYWDAQVPVLARTYRVVTLDLAGH